LFSVILNGLEFAGRLRESADLRKHKFIPAEPQKMVAVLMDH